MSGTSWQSAPWMSKQEFLLKDGTVVLSPEVEVTTSGRRVRVTGTTDSVGKNQYQELIERSIDTIAAQRGTSRWLHLASAQEDLKLHKQASPAPMHVDVTTNSVLHLTTGDRTAQSTTAVFEFEAVGIPQLKSYVWVHLASSHYGLSLTVQLTYRNLHPSQGEPKYNAYNGTTESWEAIPGAYPYDSAYQELHQKICDTQPFGDFQPFGVTQFGSQPRTGVAQFLEICKGIMERDSLVIPDTRNPQKIVDAVNAGPGPAPMLEFKFTKSNYSAALKRQLLDFVQAGPSLDRVKEHYVGLVQALKDLGVVVTTNTDKTTLETVLGGDMASLSVTFNANEDVDVAENGLDKYHSVVLDFASGSAVVTCLYHQRNEIAENWNVALFKAEMAGQTDVLLEYARAYNDKKEQARLKKILKQRKIPDITTA